MKKRLKNYFIPHKGNKYTPHSLQQAAVMGMMIMVLLSFSIANLQSVIWPTSDWLISSILPAVIVELTNDERDDGQLGTLHRSAILDRAATLKAQDMARKQYFSHNSPEGVTPWYWFGQAGYTFVHAGENLAIHFSDSGDVVDAWMESPTHRANIMNGKYTEIGVGTAEGTYQGFDTVYVVQLFGTPAAVANEPVSVAAAANNADPEPIVVVSPPQPAEVLSAELNVAEEVVEIPEPEASLELTVTDSGLAAFSNFVSTSTGAQPAAMATTGGSTSRYYDEPAGMAGYLTRPHYTLEFLYSLIGVFVVLALFLAVFIEIRRQNPLQVAYALMLLGVMYGLWELHTALTGGAIIV